MKTNKKYKKKGIDIGIDMSIIKGPGFWTDFFSVH